MKQYNYIYKITNKINGKIYIGKHSTDKLGDSYMGSGKLLRKAKSKYGKDAFEKEIIAFTDDEDSLNFLERFYIKKYKSRDLDVGYNITIGGEGTIGKIFTEEYRNKISVAAKERLKNVENHPFYGKHHSEETKQKISKSHMGITHIVSDEIKLKLHNMYKGRRLYKGENPMTGKSANRGKHWFTNGIKNSLSYTCPEGYVPGKIIYNNKVIRMPKYEYVDKDNNIHVMNRGNAKKYHPEWIERRRVQ